MEEEKKKKAAPLTGISQYCDITLSKSDNRKSTVAVSLAVKNTTKANGKQCLPLRLPARQPGAQVQRVQEGVLPVPDAPSHGPISHIQPLFI